MSIFKKFGFLLFLVFLLDEQANSQYEGGQAAAGRSRRSTVGEKSKKACESWPSPRMIFNGVKSAVGEFPHMALIAFGPPNNYTYKCGGSLISTNFVLTAAHCSWHKTYKDATFVLLGVVNYKNPIEIGQKINIRRIIKHPKYKSLYNYHDVALFELEKHAQLNKNVAPACLYLESRVPRTGIITGWGLTETGKASEHLLKGVVEYFTPEECNPTYVNDRKLPQGIDYNIMFCYGPRNSTTDTCEGDSGGPLQLLSKGTFYIFGVTSFGKSCGNQGIAGVYVKLQPYIGWIESVVWP